MISILDDQSTDKSPSCASIETWSQEQNIQELLANFGSNVWVISEGQLEANFRAWLQVAGSAEKIWYPVKANPSPVVLEVLQRLLVQGLSVPLQRRLALLESQGSQMIGLFITVLLLLKKWQFQF